MCIFLLASQTWVRHLQGHHDCDCFPTISSTAYPSLSFISTSLISFGPRSPIKASQTLLLHFLFPILCVKMFLSLFLLIVGRCLPHTTQLSPGRPPAVHPRRALPAEGVQRSHPLPRGHAWLRPRKRGQEECRGEEGKSDRERETGREFQAFHFITSPTLSFSLRFSAPSTRWSLTTRITSCFW